MMGLFFHEGAGPVIYMRLTGQRRDFRVSPEETWLTVHRRRLVSDLNITFRFCFYDFFGLGNLFWL